MAGKGRTGTVICCFLLYCGKFESADSVFDYYSKKRFSAGEGVTQPSQRRYVYYFEKMLKDRVYIPRAVAISNISVNKIPFVKKSLRPFIEIYLGNGSQLSFTTKSDFSGQKKIYAGNANSISITNPEFVYSHCGDITVKLYHHKRLSIEKIARVAFNTAFLDENQDVLIFKLNECDPDSLARKGFPVDFEIRITVKRLCNCSNKDFPIKVCDECSKFNQKEINDWNLIHSLLDNHKTSPEQASFQLFGNGVDDVMATLKTEGDNQKDDLNGSFEGDCNIF